MCLSQGDFTAMMLVLNDNLSEGQMKPPAKPVTTQTVPGVLPGETIVADTAGELWFFVLCENQSVVETKLPVKPVTTQTVPGVLPGETIVADTAGELWFFVLNENQSVVETELPVKPVSTQIVSDVLPGETIVADTAGELWFFSSPQQSTESILDFGHICNIEFWLKSKRSIYKKNLF